MGIPTSEATRRQAAGLGIPLTTLDEHPSLDLTIDGADEIDSDLRAIKGGGGALLREKIVAAASRRMVVIADSSKRVERLGAFPLPVEVVRFGREATRRHLAGVLEREGFAPDLRWRNAVDGSLFVTDSGHAILDAHLVAIPDPERLAAALSGVPGIVEHGLFIGLVTAAIIGANTGTIEIGPF